MFRSLLFLLLCAALPAQVVHLANHGSVPFFGWKRVTVDVEPPHEAGFAGADASALYVVGEKINGDCWAVDMRVGIDPGDRQTFDLGASTVAEWAPEELPADPGAWFGGPLRLNGRDMQLLALTADGAALRSHLRAHLAPLWVIDVWLRWYPGQPWAVGEVMVTASNPAVPDLFADVPTLNLAFGTAIIDVYGRGVTAPLVEPGTQFADGQVRIVPITCVWLDRLRGPADWANVGAVGHRTIAGVGIHSICADGNPAYPAAFDALAWLRRELPRAQAVLHSWAPASLNIAPNSGQTGSQEGQQFVRGEALLDGGVGAELVAYLAALKWSNRPCHHLEADGDLLRLDEHPRLIVWNGRAHVHSADQLGKVGQLAQWDTPGGWFGPDRQHWIVQGLGAAHRLTGSDALQHLLRHQQRLYMASQTVDPAKSTNTPGSARSPGYEGMLAVELWRELRDRSEAEAIAARWRARVERVLIPAWQDAPGGVWDVRADQRILQDLSSSYTRGVMFWQQSFGAYGIDLGCAVLGSDSGRDLAYQAALAVLRHAWRQQPDGKWIFWDNVGYVDGEVLPESEYVEGRGAHRTGWFDDTWALPGIAVILRHDPRHKAAREIWKQVARPNSWMPPGVR